MKCPCDPDDPNRRSNRRALKSRSIERERRFIVSCPLDRTASTYQANWAMVAVLLDAIRLCRARISLFPFGAGGNQRYRRVEFEQAGVEAVEFEQAFVAAGFDHLALVHDDDLLRPAYGGEAMGEQDRDLSGRHGLEVVEDLGLGLRVHGGGARLDRVSRLIR